MRLERKLPVAACVDNFFWPNENGDQNEKQITWIRHKPLGLDANIVNAKRFSI